MKIPTSLTAAVILILAAALILTAALVLLIGQRVRAEEAKAGRTHWVIILTIIDRTTGERLRQSKLGGTELEFDDLSTCKSIMDRVQPTPTEHLSAVLSCQSVEPTQVDHVRQNSNEFQLAWHPIAVESPAASADRVERRVFLRTEARLARVLF
jgi:hypothetical protein